MSLKAASLIGYVRKIPNTYIVTLREKPFNIPVPPLPHTLCMGCASLTCNINFLCLFLFCGVSCSAGVIYNVRVDNYRTIRVGHHSGSTWIVLTLRSGVFTELISGIARDIKVEEILTWSRSKI